MAEIARLQVVVGARMNEFNKEMGALQKKSNVPLPVITWA